MDEKAWNPYLRSTKVVTGYHIQASDGEIGHVEDITISRDTGLMNRFPGRIPVEANGFFT
jgi:hypothetical protein